MPEVPGPYIIPAAWNNLPAMIGSRTKLLYGFGTVAYGIKDNGFNLLLLIFYNQVLGLPAQLVGLAIMIALVVDGFVDPIIGHVSDRFHSRLGRRHLFMYASALPCAIFYYLLWNPPANLSTAALFVYLLATAIIVRMLIALYEVPSAALLAELSEDYDQRTSLVVYRFFFGYVGAVMMGVIAFSIYLRPTAEQPVGMLNRAGYHGYSIAAAALIFLAIIVSTAGTHGYIPYLRAPPPKRRFNLAEHFREIRAALANRPFLAILACGFWSHGQRRDHDLERIFFYLLLGAVDQPDLAAADFSIAFGRRCPVRCARDQSRHGQEARRDFHFPGCTVAGTGAGCTALMRLVRRQLIAGADAHSAAVCAGRGRVVGGVEFPGHIDAGRYGRGQ